MKLTLLFVMFGACCVYAGLNAAEDDQFFSQMKGRIAQWDETGLRKAWTDEPSSDSYEFFLWDKENDALQWFVIHTTSDDNQPRKVTIYFGIGGKQTGSKTLDPSRAAHLLSEIGKSELFRLPALVHDADAPQVTFTNTGWVFFLGRRKQGDRSTEVFRWVGESYPVDKVVDAVTSVTTNR